MELRHYARAKQAVERADENTVLSEWDKYWVFEVETELIKRRKAKMDARKAEEV